MRGIQQRTGTVLKKPFIGSGKIKRIVVVSSPHKRKGYHPLKLQEKRRTEKKEEKVIFENHKIKEIFYHWSSMGKPFVSHRLVVSKTLTRALNGIKRALGKHEMEKIITSIDLCHVMFNSNWFIFDKTRFGIRQLTLGNFFKYSAGAGREIEKRYKVLHKAKIKSWFQECLNGERYLKKNYNYYIEDKNPYLTKKLKQVWEEYDEDKVTSPKDINGITSCCNKAVAFSDLNNKLGFNPMEIISTIDRMINQFKNFKPKHLGYLTNEIFWSRQLPKELVRFGTVLKTDKSKIKLLG